MTDLPFSAPKIEDFAPHEQEAFLRALRYWQQHWDWECPTLFGFGLDQLNAIEDQWPAILESNAELTVSALRGALAELMYGGSAIARHKVHSVLGIDYAEAGRLFERLPRVE